MFLSSILDVPFVVDKDVEKDPKAQKELKEKMVNPHREVMFKDPTNGAKKLFNLVTKTGKDGKEEISVKPASVFGGLGDLGPLDSLLSPKPKIDMNAIASENGASNTDGGLVVGETSSIIIPLKMEQGLNITPTVKQGTVTVNGNKIIYTAPSLSNIPNYNKYKDGDIIGTATITINSFKPGYLKNTDNITVSIKKESMVADNSVINDNLEQYKFDSKNLVVGG